MTSAITRLQLLGDSADELTKFQADAELREIERKRARADLQHRHDDQQAATARNSETWKTWADERADARIFAHMQKGGLIHEPVGAALGEYTHKVADDLEKKLRAEIAELRGELTAALSRLHDKLRDELDRLSVVERERRELERALIQTNLDASNARITGAIEAATTKLRSEFDVAAVADELHDELRRRLPVVEPWEQRVFYRGDIVTHNNSTFQARRDTGQPPDHQDWTCIARAGVNGADGRTPCLRGTFDAYKTYARLDVVEYDSSSYIAVRDLDPGTIPGEDDWQLVARHGGRGPKGAVGPRGRKGEKGAPGADAPVVVSWTLDHKRYTAIPTMSNGTQGAVLELRGLFEQFQQETT